MQDAFIWARQANFPSQLLGSLRDLNRRFLDLAAAHGPAGGPLKLPQEPAAHLARLSAAQRAAAAECPYALFDLRFDDHTHWRSRLAGAGPWCVADEPAVDPEIAGFVGVALFYAWHVASTPRFGAQLWLGMAESTAAAFRGVSLHCLPALVAGEAANLSARWCTSAFYWRALACAALRDDARRLRKVQLFGLQLGAACLLPGG